MLARPHVAALWLLVACACGDEPPVRTVAPEQSAEEEPTDAVLAAARAQIENGAIAPQIAEVIKSSTAPQHQRARRVLLAMDGEQIAAPVEDAATEPPPVIAPQTDDSSRPPAPVAAAPATRGDVAPSEPANPRPGDARPVARPSTVVKGLRLRPTKRGATLSIQASRSVPVGIVHQSESGLVRLVIEADDALPSVLSQHAAIDGARITSVRRGRDSVFVTLTLQPGWALGSIQRVAGGARMELIRP